MCVIESLVWYMCYATWVINQALKYQYALGKLHHVPSNLVFVMTTRGRTLL
jgi:hypothetical protein